MRVKHNLPQSTMMKDATNSDLDYMEKVRRYTAKKMQEKRELTIKLAPKEQIFKDDDVVLSVMVSRADYRKGVHDNILGMKVDNIEDTGCKLTYIKTNLIEDGENIIVTNYYKK